MATHSNILTWRIQRIEEPSGLQTVGSQSVGYELSTEPARSNHVSSLTVDASFLEVSAASLSGVPESHQQRTPPQPPPQPHPYLPTSPTPTILQVAELPPCKRRGCGHFSLEVRTQSCPCFSPRYSPRARVGMQAWLLALQIQWFGDRLAAVGQDRDTSAEVRENIL